MIIQKITTGYVVQLYDTEQNKFTSQSFVAGDEVALEKEDGSPINIDELSSYLAFDMIQPR